MLQAALGSSRHAPPPPSSIYWRLPLLSWSRGMLDLLNRSPFAKRLGDRKVRIVVGNASRLPPAGCRAFGSRPPGQWFSTPEAAAKVQRTVLAACGLSPRRSPREPRNAIFMPREARNAVQSRGWRNFAAPAAVRAAVEAVLPPSALPLRVVGTPGDDMSVCEQLAIWNAADVLVTPNGAHFVSAPFLAPGAVVLEGVPWAMRAYVGQAHTTRWAPGVHHVRVHSTRPPPSAELGHFGHWSEEACAASELCRRRYRDRAMLHVDVGAMGALLRAALALVRAGCEDAPGWANPYGRTCADYATPVPPSERGKASKLEGGWCEAGRLRPEAQWAGGAVHGWPERHCCACGRNVSSA